MVDKLLAEWFWADRWSGSSAFGLSLEARGLYREMLTQAWRRGARLPNDPVAIQRIVGATADEWTRCWPSVASYWHADAEGFLVNDTQVAVYAESLARAERIANRASKGGKERWRRARADAQERAQASAQAVLGQCSPSPSPSPSEKQRSARGAAFAGKRIRVPQFLHEELERLKGRIEFDLLGWYPKLDAELEGSGDPIGDEIAYVRQRFLEAAQIDRPNLFGRKPQRAPGTEPCPGAHNPACKSLDECARKTRAEHDSWRKGRDAVKDSEAA